jgi:hypothetical protein
MKPFKWTYLNFERSKLVSRDLSNPKTVAGENHGIYSAIKVPRFLASKIKVFKS